MIANSVAAPRRDGRGQVALQVTGIERQPVHRVALQILKYRPDYPDRFATLSAARAWMRRFEHWYNQVHYHCAIGYDRLADLHDGTHHAITPRRAETLQRAEVNRKCAGDLGAANWGRGGAPRGSRIGSGCWLER